MNGVFYCAWFYGLSYFHVLQIAKKSMKWVSLMLLHDVSTATRTEWSLVLFLDVLLLYDRCSRGINPLHATNNLTDSLLQRSVQANRLALTYPLLNYQGVMSFYSSNVMHGPNIYILVRQIYVYAHRRIPIVWSHPCASFTMI